MNRAYPLCHSHENGNLSFLIIVTEPPIKQHVQAQFTKLQKIF